MPDKITLIRQDGSRLDASPEQAEKLKLLGYKEETPEELAFTATKEAASEYYTSPEQKVTAGAEGFLRGVSAGGTDYLFGDEETNKRIKYNPGLASATEIGGALASEFIPGLDVVAPTALLGRGARAAIKGEGYLAKIGRGALEGGVFGGAMEADHAYLRGDPQTAEAVLHGVGWGTLFGAGLSGVGAAFSSRGTKLAEEGEGILSGVKAGEDLSSREATLATKEAELAQERAALAQSKATYKTSPQFEATPGAFKAATEPVFASMKAEARNMATELKQSADTVEAILGGNKKELAKLGFDRTMSEGAAGRARIEVDSAFRRVSKAMSKKGFTEEKLTKAIEEYEKTVGKAANKAGLSDTGSGRQALMEYAQAKLIQRELKAFPHSAEAFAGMTQKKAESLFAALGEAKKLSNFPTLGKALEDQANKFQEALGLKPEGVEGLRAAWEVAKKQVKSEKTVLGLSELKAKQAELGVRGANLQAERAAIAAERAKNPPQPYEPGIARTVVANVAGAVTYKVGAMTGHPWFALGAASRVKNWVLKAGAPKTGELVAARNASLGRIKLAAGKLQTRAGKAMTAVAGKVEPLARKLDGTLDTSTKDKQQLAKNRLREFGEASVHVKDTLYRAIEPIAIEQPELGPALHQAGIQAFQATRAMMPADPGVVSGLKSIWKPSALQSAIMSRQLDVFHDPVGAAEEMLTSGIYDPIRVKALKEIAPQIYQTLRVEALGKIQEPGFLDNMQYRDQVALGSLLDIPIHSSMKPEYIAASQALHASRNQPLPTPVKQSSSDGGKSNATSSQISTER